MKSQSLLSLAVAGTIVAGMALSVEPAHAGRRAFIGGFVGGAVAGAVVGGAMVAASRPAYYYGGPAYVAPPVYPVYPPPYYPPCAPGYLCR